MANLFGLSVDDTYPWLLNLGSALDGTLRTVGDGSGGGSPLQLSSSAVNIASGFQLGSAAVTATAANLNTTVGLPTSGNGILARNGSAWVLRSIAGTADQITITNGDATGDPTVSLVTSPVVSGTFTMGGVSVTGATVPANGIYLPTANAIGFATDSTLRMTIAATGEVGIGRVPVATVPLDVLGQIRAVDTGFVCDMRMLPQASAGSIGTFTNLPLVFQANSAEHGRVDGAGTWSFNRGVGANSLVITNSALNTRWVTITGSNGGNPVIGSSAGGLILAPAGTTAYTAAISGNFAHTFLLGAATNIMLMVGAIQGVRFKSTATAFNIEGVDSTGISSFQPLVLGGSQVSFAPADITQVNVSSTASANRTINLTGSNGGNPAITVTGGSLQLGGAVIVGASGGSNVGFYGTTPVARPTVTGSRGGNAALASLCTQLATLGLITDSTS